MSLIAPLEFEPSKAACETARTARRHLHQHPELSFEEHETSRYLIDQLQRIGLPHRSGVAGTGVIAHVSTGRPGPVTAFRADMDALPITEATGLPFQSANHGAMHACGHDMHSGILLGLAQQLTHDTSRLCGTLVFVFQPGEEANGGAQRVIDDGGLSRPDVEQIFALHVVPQLPTGYIAVRSGPMTATDDEFRITITGADAHSSEPESGVNALTVAAHVVVALEGLVATMSPFSVATVTPASLHVGEAINVIPDVAELSGMIRCVDTADKLVLRDRLRATAQGVASALRATAEVRITEGFPPVVNDARLVDTVMRAGERALASREHVVALERPHLGSEDFAYYQHAIPGAMFMLGCGGPNGGRAGLHTAEFAPDEEALIVGIRVLSAIAHTTNASDLRVPDCKPRPPKA
ncbi:MAG: M20 family metallopeptidase [Microbacterium sp.]